MCPCGRGRDSDFAMMLRIDRASVWRSVRCGAACWSSPSAPARWRCFGNLPWPSMTILPGLVASGGALLFGVNAWCLDGRGALWRENLPVARAVSFDARAWCSPSSCCARGPDHDRARRRCGPGVPDAPELAALVCHAGRGLLQVVGAAHALVAAHPYPVDLRSARATPAPPAAMVGYSARLAVSTTFTSLIFSGCAHVPDWRLSLILAIPVPGVVRRAPGSAPGTAGRTRSRGPRRDHAPPPEPTRSRRRPALGSAHGLRPLAPGRRPDRAGRRLHGRRDRRRSRRTTTATSPRRAVPATRGSRCRSSPSSRPRRGRRGCGTSSCRRSTPASTPRGSAPTAARG